jgi:hypothetical protein
VGLVSNVYLSVRSGVTFVVANVDIRVSSAWVSFPSASAPISVSPDFAAALVSFSSSLSDTSRSSPSELTSFHPSESDSDESVSASHPSQPASSSSSTSPVSSSRSLLKWSSRSYEASLSLFSRMSTNNGMKTHGKTFNVDGCICGVSKR